MKILVLGGTRYFGKRLVTQLIEEKNEVTILTRGTTPDSFANKVTRIHCDRKESAQLEKVIQSEWDVVVDQSCMNARDAESASKIFKNRCKKYVFTSTQSVYDAGAALKEDAFVAKGYNFQSYTHEKENYKESKRQAESAFMALANFPISVLRIPIVLGPDDYTKRLLFHVERIKEGKEIYFPNIKAKISFIHSKDAARALHWLIHNNFTGPMNACSADAVQLSDLVKMIEKSVGKSLVQAKNKNPEHNSPFGIEEDWFMDVSLGKKLGFESQETKYWLKDLIVELQS